MRPARLVSNAFLYTTNELTHDRNTLRNLSSMAPRTFQRNMKNLENGERLGRKSVLCLLLIWRKENFQCDIFFAHHYISSEEM